MARSSDLPEPETLVKSEEYHNEESLLAFLEHCSAVSFEDPAAGLELARYAPELAAKVAPRVSRPEMVYMDAYSVLGSSFRATGNKAEADRT